MGDGTGEDDMSDSDEDADIKMEPDDEDEFKPIDPAVVAAIKAKWKAEEKAAGMEVSESDEEENAGAEEDIIISDEVISHIIDTYTYEAGARKLKEKLYEIYREINLKYLINGEDNIPFVITTD